LVVGHWSLVLSAANNLLASGLEPAPARAAFVVIGNQDADVFRSNSGANLRNWVEVRGGECGEIRSVGNFS
jgi:hypothetical protein